MTLKNTGFTLVLGGQRSGKSKVAEKLVEAAGGGWYIATGEPHDEEFALRIRIHQERRGDGWQTVEEPLQVRETLISLDKYGRPALVDCLTLWLTNLVLQEKNVDSEIASLCALKNRLSYPVVFVSNEVGHGIIPETKLGRKFVDLAGDMNQKIAAAANRVIFVTAGISTILK